MAHTNLAGHRVIDGDGHYIAIDPVSRQMTTESKKIMIMQYDHNSERITFEVPRKVESHDMRLCDRVEVHWRNTNSAGKSIGGVYKVPTVLHTIDGQTIEYDPRNSEEVEQYFPVCNSTTDEETGKVTYTYTNADGDITYQTPDRAMSVYTTPDGDEVETLVYTWLISGDCTEQVGTLSFLVRFMCTTIEEKTDEDGEPIYEEKIAYAWSTKAYPGSNADNAVFSVIEGMNYTNEQASVMESALLNWEIKLVGSNAIELKNRIESLENRFDNERIKHTVDQAGVVINKIDDSATDDTYPSTRAVRDALNLMIPKANVDYVPVSALEDLTTGIVLEVIDKLNDTYSFDPDTVTKAEVTE